MALIVGKENPKVYSGIDAINQPQSEVTIDPTEQSDGLKTIHEVADEKRTGALSEPVVDEVAGETVEEPVEEQAVATADVTAEKPKKTARGRKPKKS